MLLSLKWLQEFVPFTHSAKELGERLTMLGLELEEVLRPFDNIEPIVIGHVVECAKHPEADKLSVCKVDVAQAELLDIVCGAPNVAQGQKVPVALVGTSMPDGLVIKKAKLRGQVSLGMICSERELGLTDDHSGIMVLPEDAPIGTKLVDYLDLDREVLDIGITPNRADCMSVLGIAREVALAYDLPLTMPKFAVYEKGPSVNVPITIADASLCPLYQGRVIENVKIGPSPAKLRYRLHAVGVRPISNIVDITNYVLMECGQPLHAFDANKLRGNCIHVDLATEGETLVTLDGQERKLKADDLTIRDAEGPTALAGVMGGFDSEITAESHTVFLESAVFRPASIRKTSRRLGLSSEASYRFERGVDQVANTWAMDRAASLMAELAGGQVCRGVCKAEPLPFNPRKIKFRLERANSLLGLKLEAEFCHKVLQGLGCKINDADATCWEVVAPSWRGDFEREADLIEEVGRVYGLDRIEPVLPVLRPNLEDAGAKETGFSFWSRIKNWGQGLGLNEAVNYSFVGHKDLDFLNLPTEERVSILNPLSAEQDALRTALAPGLLQTLRHNIAQGNAGVRIFELAHIFMADSNSETTVKELGRLGLLLYGARFDGTWPHVTEDADYSDIKGIVEHLFAFLHIKDVKFIQFEGHQFLSPCIDIQYQGKSLGFMGQVKANIADDFHAKKPVWLAEIDLDLLYELNHSASISFKSLPMYPPVRRDITVMSEQMLAVGAVIEHVQAMKLALLEDISLIDLFEPEAGGRNATYRLTFRHEKRTLKDTEVDKEREKVAQSLIQTLGVRI